MSIITKVLLVIVGIAFLFLAYLNKNEAHSFLADSETTYGKVVDFKLDSTTRTGSRTGLGGVYRPVIEYTVNGRKMHVTHSHGANPPEHEIGDVFEVIYRKSDPADAKVNLPVNIFGPAYISAFAGAMFIILGVGRFPKETLKKSPEM